MRTRRTAANPYLPAETNPFGQQENPFVPMNENIEQDIAPTEPEGPRVVTAPQTPQTAKPRGEVVTVDARLDRMKVAVVCESCGQCGMLRLGQVSERTRCRCGSARVELLEASRKTAYFLEGDDWDYMVDPDGDGLMVVLLEDGQIVDSVGGIDVSYWISDHGNVHIRDHDEDYEYVKSIALEMREQRTGSRRYAEKECTCWEGYERVPGTKPCASGSCRKKSSRRTASGWMKSLNPHHFYKTVVKGGYELNLFVSDVDYRWTVDVMVAGDSSTLELHEQGIGTSIEDAKRQAEQSAQFFQG